MALQKEIRIQNVPKPCAEHIDEIHQYFGVSVAKLIQADTILAIKKLHGRIPKGWKPIAKQ